MSKPKRMINHEEMKARGFRMRDPGLILCAYDPSGDGNDRDAIVMIQREEWRRGELHDPDLAMEYMFRVLMAEYMDTNWTFMQKMARLLALNRAMMGWRNKRKSGGHVMLVESNGVGYAAASMLAEKITSTVRSYSTVARLDDDSHQDGKLSMPRLAALDNMRMLLDLERIKGVPGAPGMSLLAQEMNSLVWARAGRPEAITGQRDDMMMAMTAATWFGSKVIPPITSAMPVSAKGVTTAQRSGITGVQPTTRHLH